MNIMPIPNQQWKYLLIGEAHDIRGTDSDAVAVAAAEGGADIVVEVPTCKVIIDVNNGELNANNIPEQTDYTV